MENLDEKSIRDYAIDEKGNLVDEWKQIFAVKGNNKEESQDVPPGNRIKKSFIKELITCKARFYKLKK